MTAPPPSEAMNIILVDDDDGDAKAIRRAFAKARIANPITRFVDPVEALAFLRRETGTPPGQYILLVDINMPRMSGLEMLDALRADQRLHDAVVFMLTTSQDERDLMVAHHHNVAGYIVKQNAGADFLALLDTLDHYWRIVELPDMRRSALEVG
ncbi:response regulator [Pseudooceanicola atlanticus]|uniref:Chemotaxis protein CheY n=1 Tax=Pseudooceanicola atlanticus TaxID=1461694 RepID=A0A0A0EHG8_9RHOB|nr:response regulator [Pseudooceanicola atlanticus]KGM48647.1 chemotaxis protein CheY [Pseudooceanicola atlanticus]